MSSMELKQSYLGVLNLLLTFIVVGLAKVSLLYHWQNTFSLPSRVLPKAKSYPSNLSSVSIDESIFITLCEFLPFLPLSFLQCMLGSPIFSCKFMMFSWFCNLVFSSSILASMSCCLSYRFSCFNLVFYFIRDFIYCSIWSNWADEGSWEGLRVRLGRAWGYLGWSSEVERRLTPRIMDIILL